MERSENEISAYHALTRALVQIEALTLPEVYRLRDRVAFAQHKEPDDGVLTAALVALDVLRKSAQDYDNTQARKG